MDRGWEFTMGSDAAETHVTVNRNRVPDNRQGSGRLFQPIFDRFGMNVDRIGVCPHSLSMKQGKSRKIGITLHFCHVSWNA
jgi:hypothetical protein